MTSFLRLVIASAVTLAACGGTGTPPPPPPAASAADASDSTSTAASEPAVSSPDAGGASTATPATTPASATETDPQAALASAKAKGRGTLLVFCAKWVATCSDLGHVLGDTAIQKTIEERFVLARVDLTQDDAPATKELGKKYNVKGLPLILVYDRKGREVAREIGQRDPHTLSKLLDRVK